MEQFFYRGKYGYNMEKKLEIGETAVIFPDKGFKVFYRWGISHDWGCEDAGYLRHNEDTGRILIGVFDGFSYTSKGPNKGGEDSELIARKMPELFDRLEDINFFDAFFDWAGPLGRLATTAIAVSIKGNSYEAVSISDSIIQIDGQVMNPGESLRLFERKNFMKLSGNFNRIVRIYSDGAFSAEDDLIDITYEKRI